MAFIETLREETIARRDRLIELLDRLKGYESYLDEALSAYNAIYSIDKYGLNIGIAGTAKALAEAFRVLRKLGFEPEERPKEGTYSYASYFVKEGEPPIYLSFSSTQCRLVQVGVKTITQPIYETRCDENGTVEPSKEDDEMPL